MDPLTPAGIEPANLGSRGEYDNHWTTGVDSRTLRILQEAISAHKSLLHYSLIGTSVKSDSRLTIMQLQILSNEADGLHFYGLFNTWSENLILL